MLYIFCELDSAASGHGVMAEPCEHDNEFGASIKDVEFLWTTRVTASGFTSRPD